MTNRPKSSKLAPRSAPRSQTDLRRPPGAPPGAKIDDFGWPRASWSRQKFGKNRLKTYPKILYFFECVPEAFFPSLGVEIVQKIDQNGAKFRPGTEKVGFCKICRIIRLFPIRMGCRTPENLQKVAKIVKKTKIKRRLVQKSVPRAILSRLRSILEPKREPKIDKKSPKNANQK